MLGGSPAQIGDAVEIALEHHLGMEICITAMRQTGEAMTARFKQTSLGGLE
ncbi:hypothetical protein [Bosea sp. 2RAB26]|uniref:hypothetical protein n=1 Tax=Bosea sp. 2RAB26 TaxID=3237476 RepID=UPI003F91F252